MKNRSWIFHLPLYPAIYFCHFNSKTRLLANWVWQPPLSFLWSIIFGAFSLIFVILSLIANTLPLICYHFIIGFYHVIIYFYRWKPGCEQDLATSPVVPLIILGNLLLIFITFSLIVITLSLIFVTLSLIVTNENQVENWVSQPLLWFLWSSLAPPPCWPEYSSWSCLRPGV